MKYNQSIDAIYINFREQMDESIIHSKPKYQMIDLFPKMKKTMELLKIPQEKFYMKDKKLSSRVMINHEGVYLIFKTEPPRTGNSSNHSKKICSIQLKNEWLSANTYEDFLNFYNEIEVDSVSKVEVAIDVESNTLLNETINLFVNHREKVPKFDGEHNIYINLDLKFDKGLSYNNSSKIFKVYGKNQELKTNLKKCESYYKKFPDNKYKEIVRIEIGYMTSKRIKQVLNLSEDFKNKKSEQYIIEKVKKEFFSEFNLKKNCELKRVIQEVLKI